MKGGYGDGIIGFSRLPDTPGVLVTDRVEDRQVRVETDTDVSLTPSDPDSFVAPLDDAVTFYASRLEFPRGASRHILDERGDHVREVTGEQKIELPRGTYYFVLQTGFHLYLRMFDAAASVQVNNKKTVTLEFDEEARIELGARSLHERPAGTVTTTSEPESMMAAVSTLGSGVKEWSPERSWFTLRGHPPRIEVGDELSVPDSVEMPNTGVVLSVPRDRRSVYRVSPLATYLGATVEPSDGTMSTLQLENGYSESLGRGRNLEANVDEMLARVIFLDSLVRIGGYYDFDRYEYAEVASDLPFYPPELYDSSLSEQLMEYLEVPFGTIEPYLPTWPLAATLSDDPADVELLPHLANELARVRITTDGAGGTESSVSPTVLHGTTSTRTTPRTVQLRTEAFERALSVSSPAPSDAKVSVVGAPNAADAIRTVVSGHVDGTVDVVEADDATSDALGTALASDVDCLVVGTTATDGSFACENGELRLAGHTVNASNVVFADADAATAAGAVDAGAVNAVSVAGDDRGAGRLAGYLVAGVPTGQAARFASLEATWWVVGDPTHTTTTKPDGPISAVRFDAIGDEQFRGRYQLLISGAYALGTVGGGIENAFQDANVLDGAWVPSPTTVDIEEIVELTHQSDHAVALNGERIHDTSKVTPAFVRESARRALAEREREGVEAEIDQWGE